MDPSPTHRQILKMWYMTPKYTHTHSVADGTASSAPPNTFTPGNRRLHSAFPALWSLFISPHYYMLHQMHISHIYIKIFCPSMLALTLLEFTFSNLHWGKKTAPFYFCYNFVKSFYIGIIKVYIYPNKLVVQWHDPTFLKKLVWPINNHFFAFFNSS